MATLDDNWPAITDDTGAKTDGTLLDETLFAAIKAAIEAAYESTGNPTVSAADIIDEVVAARGSLGALDTRLDVAINEDGTLKAIAGQASTTQLAELAGATNWVLNDDFLIWAGGDAAAPSSWALSGAGATIARTGTGLGDTATKVGPFSAKVTRAAADAKLSQYLLNATSFADAAILQSKSFTVGAWVKTGTASHARLSVADGVGTTESSYHTGGGGWEFLTLQHTLDASASYLQVRFEVNSSSGDAYVSGFTALPGSIGLDDWIPTQKTYGMLIWKVVGTLTIGDGKDYSILARPGIIKDVALFVGTTPSGASIDVQLARYNGATYDDIFSTKPSIAAGAYVGAEQPDGTYEYRCLAGGGDNVIADTLLRFDIDQVGAGAAGADLFAHVRILQYSTPQENLRAFNDIGSA